MEMGPGLVAIIFFSGLMLLLALGFPVAFALGSLGIIGCLLIWPPGLYQVATTAFDSIGNFVIVAVPLFIFMAEVLMFSGLSDDLYGVVQKWLGWLPGGLATSTITASAIFAAISGTSTAGAAAMGTVALPAMHTRKYDMGLATGCVAAGGALGILIPPSVIMIIYGVTAQESIGQLFMGGVVPGILLSVLFMVYITIRCLITKSMGPPGPSASWQEKFGCLWRLSPTVILIVAILGSIYLGVATPTEASAVGVVGAIIIAAAYRKLSWLKLRNAMAATTRAACMVLWIMIGAISFVHFISYSGMSEFISQFIIGLSVSPWMTIIIMQFILLLLGCFLDPLGILMITAPVFLPIVHELGFSGLWFGILFTINMEAAFITPPFGFNLFIIRSIAPEGVTMGDVYRGIIPFTILDVIGLGLVMAFPQLALWLPSTMIGR